MDSHAHNTAVIAQEARPRHAQAKYSRALIVTLSGFSLLSCIAGGLALVIWPGGSRFLPPLDLLRFTPFHDYFVPGLILLIAVGGAQLLCLTTNYQRTPSAPLACAFAGGTLSVWIVAQAAMIRALHPLHGLYLAMGLALLVVGTKAAWQRREPRTRWLVGVTAGELLGFAVPAATGILVKELEASGGAQVIVLGLAGAVEGLLLGAAQAWAWPLPIRRVRYALLTSLAAALVWTSAMLLVQLMKADDIPTQVVVATAAATVLLGLPAIGFAQWIELRHHARRAWRFIGWSALAWLLALPFSFAPGPFVDESTPFAPQLALWTIGGLLMALVMALVTWLGVRTLTRDA
jgi:hypothetical protein